MPDLLLHPRDADPLLEVTPELAGWRYLSFAVRRLPAGGALELQTGGDEVCVVLLGGRCTVEAAGERFELGGRRTVFDGMPSALYLPPGTPYRVDAAEDVELATCGARAEQSFPPRLIQPADVAIETRGAGNATRQINHILTPEFPAQRLLVVEVYTPAGNWSSFPPHRHEQERRPEENRLEEVYYYRVERPEGFGLQRLYTDDRSLDRTWSVADGDLLMVPRGYHPFVAAHGYDCYYLNALAADWRSMAAADDPDLAWVRESWNGLPTDPRVPLVGRT